VKWRTTVVLAIVALCLGVLLLLERKAPTTTQREEDRQLLFGPPYQADEVSRLVISHGDVTVTLERPDPKKTPEAHWRMTKPLQVRADTYTCDQIAGDLASLKWESRMSGAAEGPETLAERGLDAPRATLTFTCPGGQETLTLGDDTPIGGRVYMSVAGRPDVFEVRKSFLTTLLKPVNEFRDDDVVVFDVPDVEKMTLQRPREGGGSLTCAVEREGSRWLLTDPLPVVARADRDVVEDGLKKLNGLKVERFTADAEGEFSEDDLAQYGLKDPVLVAEVTAAGETAAISFGDAVPDHPDQRYAMTSEGASIYAVKADAAEFLARPTIAFRDRQLTPMTADRVQSLVIALSAEEGGERAESVKIVRDESAWRITEPREIEADEEAVRELLRDVDTRTVTDFVKDFAEPPTEADLSAYGLDRPRTTVTLTSDTVEEEIIHVGARDEEGQRCYIRRGDEPIVLAVDESFLDLVLQGYLDYRTKKLAEVSRYDVTRIHIDRPAGSVELVKEKTDWELAAPVEKRAERSAVDDLLFELTPLQADRILTEEADDLAAYGLAEPEYRLQVTVEKEGEEAETTALSVGSELPEGGRTARLGDERLIAALPDTFVERLDAEFRYRTVLSFDGDKVDEVTVTKPDSSVVVTKADDAWQLAEPADAELDSAKVGRLLDELKRLRVERWETYEADDLSLYGLDKPTAVVSVRVGGLEPVTHTLMFGSESEGSSVFARLEGDAGVFVLLARALEKTNILVDSSRADDRETSADEPAESQEAPAE
jgi:hypothetical protein